MTPKFSPIKHLWIEAHLSHEIKADEEVEEVEEEEEEKVEEERKDGRTGKRRKE